MQCHQTIVLSGLLVRQLGERGAGYARLLVGNLFAVRATRPVCMKKQFSVEEAIGDPANIAALQVGLKPRQNDFSSVC